jgi:hypothetical protein
MGIGGCIVAFAAGAILTFGVNWHLAGMNIHVVGVILMAAGLLGLATYIGVYRRRFPGDRVGPGTEVVEERRYYDGP